MNAVFIGCGSIAPSWFDVIKDRSDIEMTGLVDRSRSKADRINEKYGWKALFFDDYKTALIELEPEVVMVATRPDSHFEIACFALDRGCHVLLEKPLAESLNEGIELKKRAAKAGKSLFVMQNRRYLSRLKGLKESLSEGCIGEPSLIQADFFVEPHFGGFREEMEHPLILDMSIHTFDQARFLTGCDPVSVYCEEYNMKESWFKGMASASCIFEMTGGLRFIYNGSWTARGNLTSWESEWRIQGSLGAAGWDGKNEPFYEVRSPKERDSAFPELYDRTVISPPVMDEEHRGCLNEMLDSLGSGSEASTAVADNIRSLAMVMAAIESAETGKKVIIDYS